MITTIIILSLVIWGVASLFDEDMLLWFIGRQIERLQPGDWRKVVLKPVILCPPCMSSIWGTATALYMGYGIIQWLVLVFAVAGLNYIIANK